MIVLNALVNHYQGSENKSFKAAYNAHSEIG